MSCYNYSKLVESLHLDYKNVKLFICSLKKLFHPLLQIQNLAFKHHKINVTDIQKPINKKQFILSIIVAYPKTKRDCTRWLQSLFAKTYIL